MLSSPCSVEKRSKGVPALRSGTTPTEGPTAAVPRVSTPGAVGRGVAQQRGSVQVWLRPPTAALAWCAVLFPSVCRRGPLGVRHRSGLRP